MQGQPGDLERDGDAWHQRTRVHNPARNVTIGPPAWTCPTSSSRLRMQHFAPQALDKDRAAFLAAEVSFRALDHIDCEMNVSAVMRRIITSHRRGQARLVAAGRSLDPSSSISVHCYTKTLGVLRRSQIDSCAMLLNSACSQR